MEDFNYLKDCISNDWDTANNAQEKIADMMREKLFEEIANTSKIEIKSKNLVSKDGIPIYSQLCVESSVDISTKYIKDERWNVIERCFDVLKSSFIFKLNNLQLKPKYLTNLRIFSDWQFRINSQDRIGWFGWIEGIY